MNIITKTLCWIGGESSESLKSCSKKDHIKIGANAMSLTIPMIIAFAGGGSLTYKISGNSYTALIAGVTLALIMFLVDRSILTGTKSKNWSSYLCLIPRLGIVIPASYFFSESLVFLAFQGAIDNKINDQKVERIKEVQEQSAILIAEAQALRSNELTPTKKALNEELSNKDKIQISLKEQEAIVLKYETMLDDEIQGKRASGKSKYGEQAKILDQTFLKPARTKMTHLQNQLESSSQRVASKESDIRAIASGLANLPEIKSIRTQADNKIKKINSVKPAFLMQLQALHELEEEHKYIKNRHYGLALMLICLELMCIFIKVFSSFNEVDYVNQNRLLEKREESKAHEAIVEGLSSNKINIELKYRLEKFSMDKLVEHANDKRTQFKTILRDTEAEYVYLIKRTRKLKKLAKSESEKALADKMEAKIINNFTDMIESIYTRLNQPT